MPRTMTQRTEAKRPSTRLMAMLSIVALFAASCGSDGTTATADEAATTEQPTDTTLVEPEPATTEPEPATTSEPEVVEEEALPAPDAAIIAFTEAFGAADAEAAWAFLSDRCKGGSDVEVPDGYIAAVNDWAESFPGATAVNVVADFGDNNDTAAMTYDVNDGSGEFAETYNGQPWAFLDGKWLRDAC